MLSQDKFLVWLLASSAQGHLLIVLFCIGVRVASEADLNIEALSFVSVDFCLNLELKGVILYFNLLHYIFFITVTDLELGLVLLE